MIERFERFSFAISEISRCWTKIAASEMEKYGLKGSCALYLIAMYRNPEGITASHLSEKCGRDKADVSRSVSLMERNGLLHQEGDKKNLYRARLMLTDEGKQAADNIAQRAMLAVEMGGKGVNDEERGVFYDTLELIASNLREVSEGGLPPR